MIFLVETREVPEGDDNFEILLDKSFNVEDSINFISNNIKNVRINTLMRGVASSKKFWSLTTPDAILALTMIQTFIDEISGKIDERKHEEVNWLYDENNNLIKRPISYKPKQPLKMQLPSVFTEKETKEIKRNIKEGIIPK